MRACSSATPSRCSEVEKRGFFASMAVVEMPPTRRPPGARSVERVSGCGSCGRWPRLLVGFAVTNNLPFSSLTP